MDVEGSAESCDVVATRDPPLYSRPKSATTPFGSAEAPQNRRPIPHIGSTVPEFGKWYDVDSESDENYFNIFGSIVRKERKNISNNIAQPSAKPKTRCFNCFPFGHQWTKHLASCSAQAETTVTKNITSSAPLTHFMGSTSLYPSTKSDLPQETSFFGGVHVFDYKELEAATNNFDPSRELGKDVFGSVYYGVLSSGTEVAVKKLCNNCSYNVEWFMSEIKTMTGLKHTNLVTIYGWISYGSQDLLVYEYIPNGTVAEHVHGKRAKSRLLSWPVRLSIAVETANALAYLHKSDTIHQYLKTDSILIDNNLGVKVANFGLFTLFPNGVNHHGTTGITALGGTPGHIPDREILEKIDVFSFGVVLIELISSLKALDMKREPGNYTLSRMAINKIQNGTLHELVDANLGFDTDSNVRRMVTLVAELAFRCLHQDWDMRPTMEQVLQTLKQIQE